MGVAGADLRERGQGVGRRLVRKLQQKKKEIELAWHMLGAYSVYRRKLVCGSGDL